MGAFLSFITDTIHVNCCSRVEYVAPPLALRLTALSMLVPSSRLPLVSFLYIWRRLTAAQHSICRLVGARKFRPADTYTDLGKCTCASRLVGRSDWFGVSQELKVQKTKSDGGICGKLVIWKEFAIKRKGVKANVASVEKHKDWGTQGPRDHAAAQHGDKAQDLKPLWHWGKNAFWSPVSWVLCIY